jgi:hypothetical protein
MSDPSKYVPEWHDEDHVKVLVHLRRCSVCNSWTVPRLHQNSVSPFPSYVRANFDAQMERAGIPRIGSWNESAPVCSKCHESGTVSGECSICHEQRPLSAMEESIGMPAEHMCKPCYESVPAKKWKEELNRLHESHRWDFE